LSEFLNRLRGLIDEGDVLISEHGHEELAEDYLTVKELIFGITKAVIVEEYLDYPKGPYLLLLQKDKFGEPVHAVWGIPRNKEKPAVLITAFRPDPQRWDHSYTRRL